jgi:hypothetical protein
MNDRKPHVSPPPDADGPYKYYLLGGVRPVRVTCDTDGAKIFTEAPGFPDGLLRVAALLVPILKGEDVEEITRQEFIDSCQSVASEAEEIAKKIPVNLYDGIGVDADDIDQARIDRERGLLLELIAAAREAEARGDLETSASLRRDINGLRRYFFARLRGNP